MLFHLMIVDDEPTLRKGLSSFIDWASVDCVVDTAVCNGREAIEYIEINQPDIVITDIRMPECDGIALSKYIYENYPQIKVIILTGYADFEYARSAVQYQVTDFILKPTSKEKLLEAVKKAQTMVLETKNRTTVDISEIIFLQEQLFQSYTEEKEHSELEGKAEAYGVELLGYYMLAMQLHAGEGKVSCADLKSIILAQRDRGYVYSYNGLVIWLYTFDAEVIAVKDIVDIAQELTDILETLHAISISTGISNEHYGLDEIETAFLEAFSALNLNFYHGTSVMMYQTVEKDDREKVIEPEYTKSLYDIENLMQNWAFEKALSHSSLLFKKMGRNFINAITVKNLCAQIYFICSKILVNKNIDALSSGYLEEIEKSAAIQQLEAIAEEMIGHVQSCLIAQGKCLSDMVRGAIVYIHENLADNLSLDIISSNIHVNPTYLSRTFKKEYGEGIADYINGARIEKAKELLAMPNTLTYEVAGQVGFHDPSYFSATFKKFTGQSPSEYKQTILDFPNG